MSTILVTGACGFIGSQVVRELSKHAAQLVAVDNLSTGSLNYISDIKKDRFKFVHCDVRDYQTLRKSMNGVDCVIHLAAHVDISKSMDNPALVHDINTNGTLYVLEACVKSKVTRIIFASSAAVYGNPVSIPIRETDPLSPISPYGATKVCGEAYCQSYMSSFGLDVLVLRFFNVYGPGMMITDSYSGVIKRFFDACIKGRPLTVFGDGSQTRDFVHIEDVAAVLAEATECRISGIFNIGSGKAISILELAQLIRDRFNTSAKIEFNKERLFDIKDSVADISRARDILGYKPKWTPHKGIPSSLRA